MVMVMETPSPQCVGHEFVRQYYTMLNEAPLQLHRFYNDTSSFIHGGIDQPGKEAEPVYGQQKIHNKIMELNFNDCHAKIRQVDSLVTLGDGVVVQVTGELSNNGEPMRRFMQTFVLAPQAPRRFFVRNDIFRYQDEVFPDDDEFDTKEGTAVESENEEDHPEISDASDVVPDHNVSPYFEQTVSNGNAHIEEIAAVTSSVGPPAVQQQQQPQQPPLSAPPSSAVISMSPSSALHPAQSPSSTHVVIGGDTHPDIELMGKLDVVSGGGAGSSSESDGTGTYDGEKSASKSVESGVTTTGTPAAAGASMVLGSSVTGSSDEHGSHHHYQADTSPSEPKTYANMVSKNTAGGSVTGPSLSSGGGLGGPPPPATVVTNWTVSGSKPGALSSGAVSTGAPSGGLGSSSVLANHMGPPSLGAQLSSTSSMQSSGSPGVATGSSVMGSSNRSSEAKSQSSSDAGFMGGMHHNNAGGGGGSNQPQHRMQRSRGGNSMRGNMNFHGDKMYSRDRGPPRGFDDSGDGDRRRSTSQYPDSQQLFVGNLPHGITEDELKDHFSKYGSVVDVRINNRPAAKPGNHTNRGVPNFGFVVFEDSNVVQQVLSEKPIMFRDEHRLNVEEKKIKPRDPRALGGSGDGRPNMGRGGMGRPGMNSGRGGGRGGGMGRSDGGGGPRGGGSGGGNMTGGRGGGFQGSRR